MSLKSDGSLQNLPLKVLHLDDANPRFGGRSTKKRTEAAILSEIVSQHGVTDVLCSIATNGFFDSEPIVGAINKSHGKEVTIVEGNRRLSACFIIARDPRASGHTSLSDSYQSSNFSAKSLLPVKVYDWAKPEHRRKLLPFLGIRHIVGAQQWDSYAKAAWVAVTLKESELSIDDIRRMIGDEQKFIDRIVEGYYFVEQALEENAYDPHVSLRNGRGSFQEFPFSWVYTALGYKSIRSFLGLPKEITIQEKPIETNSMTQAGKLLVYMFGSSGRHAAIDDSREIGTLAQALSSSESVHALDEGASAASAVDLLRPSEKRLEELLRRADSTLVTCLGLASDLKGVDRQTIDGLLDDSEKIMDRTEALIGLLSSIKPKAVTRRTPPKTRKGS